MKATLLSLIFALLLWAFTSLTLALRDSMARYERGALNMAQGIR